MNRIRPRGLRRGLPRHASRWLAVPLAALVCMTGCKPAAVPAPSAPGTATAAPAPPSADRKMAWVLRLEDERVTRDPDAGDVPVPDAAAAAGARLTLAPAATPNLRALALDPDATIRRRALLALGRIGVVENAPLLVAALHDEDEYSRQAAAFGLGLLADTQSVTALETALRDPSPLVQVAAADALGLIGVEASAGAVADAAAGCADRLKGIDPDDEAWPKAPEVEVCRSALYALVRLKDKDALARVALDAQGQPISHWWPVAFALQRSGDARAVPALLTLASGTGLDSRAFALRGLAAAGDRRAVPLASALAADRQADVRLRAVAVRALAQLRAGAEAPALLTIARDQATPATLLIETLTALGALGGAQAFDALVTFSADPRPPVRVAAIGAAARANPTGFLLIASGLTGDADWSVRAALAGALATLPADQVRRAVEDLCDDVDVRVQGPALEALARIGADDLDRRLDAALGAADPVLRATAAQLVVEHRLPDGVARLTAAYTQGAGDQASLARMAAIGALAAYGGDEATATIRRALDDPDWPARLEAVSLLSAAGDRSAAPVRPAPVRLTPADFDAPSLLHPAYSPHAFVETARGTIEIELDVVNAPLTARAFMARARAGFYDGLVFHRVVPDFVIQTGDPRGDGEGGAPDTLRDELSPRPFLTGTVGMALAGPETGTSQFFITLSPQPHLDGKYTVFGQVVAGQDVLERVAPGDRIVHIRIWDGVSGGRGASGRERRQ